MQRQDVVDAQLTSGERKRLVGLVVFLFICVVLTRKEVGIGK